MPPYHHEGLWPVLVAHLRHLAASSAHGSKGTARREYSSPERTTAVHPVMYLVKDPSLARKTDSPKRGVRRVMNSSPRRSCAVATMYNAGLLSAAGTIGVKNCKPIDGLLGRKLKSSPIREKGPFFEPLADDPGALDPSGVFWELEELEGLPLAILYWVCFGFFGEFVLVLADWRCKSELWRRSLGPNRIPSLKFTRLCVLNAGKGNYGWLR